MSNVIPFPRCDHVVVELLIVYEDDGSKLPRYFVSPYFNGAYAFGCFDSTSRAEALEAAEEFGLPIFDKTGWRQ